MTAGVWCQDADQRKSSLQVTARLTLGCWSPVTRHQGDGGLESGKVTLFTAGEKLREWGDILNTELQTARILAVQCKPPINHIPNFLVLCYIVMSTFIFIFHSIWLSFISFPFLFSLFLHPTLLCPEGTTSKHNKHKNAREVFLLIIYGIKI